MYTVVYPVLFISIGVGAVLFFIFREEKHYAKISGKKIFNLNALLDDIRRQEEKKQHASLTAAKRARRIQARKESLENARVIIIARARTRERSFFIWVPPPYNKKKYIQVSCPFIIYSVFVYNKV